MNPAALECDIGVITLATATAIGAIGLKRELAAVRLVGVGIVPGIIRHAAAQVRAVPACAAGVVFL